MEEKYDYEKWKGTLDDLIRAKFNYENANIALKKKYGDNYAVSGKKYRERKNELVGGEKVDEKIDELGERKRVKKPKSKPAWSKQKQTVADNSTVAKLLNAGIHQGIMPFCANRELKEESIQEINPGGAIVANITYFFPESKLEHPLVTLGIRIIILYIKFKSVCGRIQRKVKEGPSTMGGEGKGGLKPGMQTDRRI
jgi:hypothetical protein